MTKETKRQVESMIDNVIKAYGLEVEETIIFAKLAEQFLFSENENTLRNLVEMYCTLMGVRASVSV